eukprot:s3412_g5.t1
MTLNAWYRNALREAWAVSCVYGSEHYSSFEQAATYLLKLGEEHAYMWPAHAIFSVWEELWSRYVEELKDLDRELRRAMKEESPTFERIRFFVTAPGADGEPWLRLPRTFFLEDGLEYFQTDIIPRHNRLLSRACWQVALKKTPGGTLYGGKAGEDPEASESRPGPKPGKVENQPKGLLGPPLTNKEAARALDHRPKEKKGAKYLCWDHLCHRGCAKPASCPHSHGAAPKWEHLDWSVQLQLLRRGGLRSQAKLSESQVTEQMENIRKEQQLKTQDMVNEGEEATNRHGRMEEINQTNFTEGFGEQLKTYVKNQLLLKKEEDPNSALGLDDVRKALERARSHGCPALSVAADEALQGANLNRAGYSPNVGYLSQFKWDGDVGHGTLTWAGGSWDVWDFGDKLYPSGSWSKELLSHASGDIGPEARQDTCACWRLVSWSAILRSSAKSSQRDGNARDYLLCPRCAQPEEVPRRSGNRPPSVLGLHLRSDASDRICEWAPGTLETKDLPTDEWSDDDLAAWLGPQADTFRQALTQGLDFLEVYAGKARASHAVTAHGGLAIYLGLDHGQDFRRAGAFPCTPFCAWIRLAILRNCDMTLRLKEGRVHLQTSDGRDAHLENPLTSLAWKEPIALRALADPRWLSVVLAPGRIPTTLSKGPPLP